MASNVNKATLLGRLGKDPEVKYTADGTAIARFSVATTEKYKDRSGESKEETSWHSCGAFGKAAEIIGEYCKKGDLIYIEGKIAYSKRTGDDGVERYYTDIKVRDFTLLGGKQDTGNSAPRRNAPQPQRREVANTGGSFDDVPLDDDIPF